MVDEEMDGMEEEVLLDGNSDDSGSAVQTPPSAKKKNDYGLLMAAVLVGIAAVAGILYVLLFAGSGKAPSAMKTATPPPVAASCDEITKSCDQKAVDEIGECFFGNFDELDITQKAVLKQLRNAGCLAEPVAALDCDTIAQKCDPKAVAELGECFEGEADTPEKQGVIAALKTAGCLDEE